MTAPVRWALLLLAVWMVAAQADEQVLVCFNYGCAEMAPVRFREPELQAVRDLLDDAIGPAHERELLGVAIGWLLGLAGQQTPIAADRGGNYADAEVNGRMDCIDHSTTTTRLLRMLERRGWLRWHRVLEPEVRHRVLFLQHWSAVIEEEPRIPLRDEDPETRLRYAVDSWFRDNGQPALVLPLESWLDGDGTIETSVGHE